MMLSKIAAIAAISMMPLTGAFVAPNTGMTTFKGMESLKTFETSLHMSDDNVSDDKDDNSVLLL